MVSRWRINSLVNLSSDQSIQLSVSIEQTAQTSASIAVNMVYVTGSTKQGHLFGLDILEFSGDVM